MPKTYDEIAPHYDRVMSPLERWGLTNLRRQIFSYLPPNGSLLEVGTGTGRNFVFYPQLTSITATEPSTEMLRIAQGKPRPTQVSLVQSCAEALPFDSHVFDAAIATLVFCSVDSPQPAFAELRRVVKPGGLVLLLEHVRPGGVLGPLFDLLNLVTSPLFGDHINRRTAAEAQASGLKLQRVESRFFGIINLISCVA